MKANRWIGLAMVAAALWLLFGGSVPTWPGFGGASRFVIVRESLNDSPSFAKAIIDLRDGSAADELKAKGYDLLVLDDEDKTPDDQPLPLLVKFGVYSKIDNDRRVLLHVKPPDTLVAQEDIPAGATAATVLASIKARGK